MGERAAVGLMSVAALFGLAAVGLGLVGALGVRSTTKVAESITSNEIATSTATAHASRAVDAAYADGVAADLSAPSEGAALASHLLRVSIPAADEAITGLVALHAADDNTERLDIEALRSQWAALRDVLVSIPTGANAGGTLGSAYQPLGSHFDRLVDREQNNARDALREASSTETSTIWVVALAATGTVLAAFGLALLGIRAVRRALRPEQAQSEFADTMQLAESENEAHALIKRHLERSVPGSDVTVLNRNNSADRLEAVTPLSPGSCLTKSLQGAQPRSCLAVRSSRSQQQNPDDQALLDCPVCGGCPGTSTCTPLTVGGEVIGAVLLTAAKPPTAEQEERLRTSVTQAAPVLANLRNLAIAELRAATDALTGLPNKRAVNDTLRRMLAQASRTLSPLAMLQLDLDHFKQVNDRHGHPVGDQALANVGAALTSLLRASDFAGRSGGEEFSILLPNTDLEGALHAAEKIRSTIGALHHGHNEPLTASIGIAVYPDQVTTAEDLERLADAALYVAKRQGRNRVEIAKTNISDTGSLPGASGDEATIDGVVG